MPRSGATQAVTPGNPVAAPICRSARGYQELAAALTIPTRAGPGSGEAVCFSLLHKDCPSSLGGGVRAVSIGFRLLSGATAPHAKPTGACVEIVFVGIRLCDRLGYAHVPP